MSIYKACDIRGVYGTELDERTAWRIGAAVGTLARRQLGIASPAVVVGGDVRTSTPPLMRELIDGLASAGCRVTSLGVVPTPAFYFALDLLGGDAGVMVTASHNPAAHNGFKLRIGPLPITPEQIDAVARLADTGEFEVGSGAVSSAEILPQYEAHVAALMPPVGGLRVVVDCSHGCYSTIAPRMLAAGGAQVVPLFCEPDGTFPAHPPNPAVADNLQALSARVREASADIGIAFDGDGDRVVFVDGRGRVVRSDAAIVVLAQRLLPGHPGRKVVYDLKCSMRVAEAISAAGCIPIMERSGHAFIKARMIAESAYFGAELSGHYFYEALSGGDDALYTALLTMRLVAAEGPLADMVDAAQPYCITPDIRLPSAGLDVPATLARLTEAADGDVSLLDGLRVAYPEGWALLRPSVTEPLVTLRFEVRHASQLRPLVRRFLAAAPELLARMEPYLHATETDGWQPFQS